LHVANSKISSNVNCTAFDVQLRRGLQSFAGENCLVLRRTIADLKNHVDLPLVGQCFAEVAPCPDDPVGMHLDPESERHLDVLVNQVLPAAVRSDNVISRSVLWRHDEGISDKLHAEYLDEACRTIRNKLVTMIDGSAGNVEPEVGDDAEVNELNAEINQHWTYAREAVEGFSGQGEALNLVHSYVISNDLRPLVVYGEAGAGKTTLIAKAALEVGIVSLNIYFNFHSHRVISKCVSTSEVEFLLSINDSCLAA
jgi:hypothetical protein